MKNLIIVTALTTTLLSTSAVAANTTELKVTGIIRPTACVPAFASGGVIDFGTIPASSLTPSAYTSLPPKGTPFSISCGSPVKVALKAIDNRASSAVPAAIGSYANLTYGLGTVAGKNVGGYSLGIAGETTTADGAAARMLYSADGSQTWTITNGNGTFGGDRTMSWTRPGDDKPLAFKDIAGEIVVRVGLEKPENLPLTQEVPLDGSATLEVLYL